MHLHRKRDTTTSAEPSQEYIRTFYPHKWKRQGVEGKLTNDRRKKKGEREREKNEIRFSLDETTSIHTSP